MLVMLKLQSVLFQCHSGALDAILVPVSDYEKGFFAKHVAINK